MKVYKILFNPIGKTEKWGVTYMNGKIEEKGLVYEGTVAFDFKNDEMELKKGDRIWYQDDYARQVNIDGKTYTSTNPSNIICQK